MPEWHGFHAARRGVGSNLNRLGVDDSFIQRILRHSNISTTQSFYIKTTSKDVLESMKKLEAEIERLSSFVPPWCHQPPKKSRRRTSLIDSA